MVFVALAAKAGTAVVQPMAAGDWEGVRFKVARLFGRGEPDRVILRRLDATRQQLDAASPGELEQAQVKSAAQWQTRFGDLLADYPDARTELVVLVEELVGSAGATSEAIPDSAWEAQMQNFIVGRYDRVQAAAQSRLTIMTTLFGVFSTVVVVSGPKTIAEIHGSLPWRIGVAAAAVAVFVLAFFATMYGLFASWGGLSAGVNRELQQQEEQEAEKKEKEDTKKNVWPELKELKDMWSPEDLELAETIDTFAGVLAVALIANGFVG